MEQPKLWKDMTPEEKGVLLLAHHEGKVIEWLIGQWGVDSDFDPKEYPGVAYRVRPEPKVTEIVQFWERDRNNSHSIRRDGDTHRITFNLIDGEPDCDSIKMEKL